MDNNKKFKHSCENCIYFRQHYIKRSDRFSATGYGHCAYGKKDLNCHLQYKKITDCAYWELLEEKKDVEKTVKNLLKDIEKNIETVKYFLTCKEE